MLLDLVEKEKELHESAITISHWYHTILPNSILELVKHSLCFKNKFIFDFVSMVVVKP